MNIRTRSAVNKVSDFVERWPVFLLFVSVFSCGAERASRWGDAIEGSDRQKPADPGAERGEQDIGPVGRVADDRESGEQIPDAAPARGRHATAFGNRSVEEHIDGVGHGGRQGDASRDGGVERGDVHVGGLWFCADPSFPRHSL